MTKKNTTLTKIKTKYICIYINEFTYIITSYNISMIRNNTISTYFIECICYNSADMILF